MKESREHRRDGGFCFPGRTMSDQPATGALPGACLPLLTLTAWALLAAGPVAAAPPGESPAVLPESLSLESAVQWALVHNPELAVIREQHGIAAAAVVIAETYPFNPFWEGKIVPN